jgi:hypothetical protein
VIPPQSWGHQSAGVAPSQLDRMRRNLKKCTHLGDTKGCTATTIQWVYGKYIDPFIDIRVQHIREWMDLWDSMDTDVRRRVRKFWSREMPGIVKDPMRWREVKGPISATIATVHDIGWKPAAPDRWRTSEDYMAMVGSAPFSSAHIQAQARRDLDRALAEKACLHADGVGMGSCIILDPAKKGEEAIPQGGENEGGRGG